MQSYNDFSEGDLIRLHHTKTRNPDYQGLYMLINDVYTWGVIGSVLTIYGLADYQAPWEEEFTLVKKRKGRYEN